MWDTHTTRQLLVAAPKKRAFRRKISSPLAELVFPPASELNYLVATTAAVSAHINISVVQRASILDQGQLALRNLPNYRTTEQAHMPYGLKTTDCRPPLRDS